MDDILKDAKADYDEKVEAFSENYDAALDDIKFGRLGEQWPDDVLKQRKGRPCLTINKLNAFIRQVVNDARQNKPAIRTHPVDGGADKKTAAIIDGLIRNIEYTSNADVAYDTATECAVGGGFGFFRIGMDYAHGDTFDLDLSVERINNPLSVYGDQNSTAADSSDWMTSFVTQIMPKAAFEMKYNDAGKVDWAGEGYTALSDPWCTEDSVMVAEWWVREEYYKQIYLLSDGTLQSEATMEAMAASLGLDIPSFLTAVGLEVAQERQAKCYKVKQHILTGAELLETSEWPGQFIPIIPVYGDEVDVEGKRHFRSLIRDAKDAQRMFNYWRSTTTELIALAPKTPFLGKKGTFKTDANKWATANTESHPYIEYDTELPQRQPFAGVPPGPMQEALTASDDMKAIMGIYDASLGQRSNETSGKAINARKVEGDTATFHFQDNMGRAIRHAGRVLIDLIPHVYNKERMIRVIGEDGTQEAVQIAPGGGQPQLPESAETQMQETQDPTTRVYDLTAGKYDVTVKSGPSFTTRRQETAQEMMQLLQAFPAAAPVVGDLLVKNLDWQGADEVAERLKKINPALNQGGIPPELQQQIQQGMQRLQQLEAENQNLKADHQLGMAEIEVKKMELDVKRQELAIKQQELQVDLYRAQTERAQPPAPPAAAA